MIRSAGAGGLCAALIAGAAFAHHGINAFDHNKDVHLVGTIVRLDFVNPHSWLYLDVAAEDGAVTHDTILPSTLPFAPDPCDDAILLDFSQTADGETRGTDNAGH